jgi:hypothetical protein
VHELQKAVKNVPEHHFGVRSGCGAWCPAIRWKDGPEKRKNLVYRDRTKDRILYEQLEATFAPFLTLDRLKETMSKFNPHKKGNTMKVITGTISCSWPRQHRVNTVLLQAMPHARHAQIETHYPETTSSQEKSFAETTIGK